MIYVPTKSTFANKGPLELIAPDIKSGYFSLAHAAKDPG